MWHGFFIHLALRGVHLLNDSRIAIKSLAAQVFVESTYSIYIGEVQWMLSGLQGECSHKEWMTGMSEVISFIYIGDLNCCDA